MKNGLFLLIAVISILCSCAENSSDMMTPEGYKYIMYNDVPGEKAKEGDFVSFEMDIFDNHGNLLQSYRNRPSTPALQIPSAENRMPGGPNPLLGVLALVSVGDSLALIIPKDSIKQAPGFYDTLQYLDYRIAVKEIQSKEDYLAIVEKQRVEQQAIAEENQAREGEVADKVAQTLKAYKAGSLKADLKTTETGLKYIIHEEAEGKFPEAGKMVSVHYYGVLLSNGKEFDNSFKRGAPYTFTLGRGEVIAAWDQCISLLKEGTKATLFAPPSLGYGESGNPPAIPANADLVFYVEVAQAF